MTSSRSISKNFLRTSYPLGEDYAATSRKHLAGGMKKAQVLEEEITSLQNRCSQLSLEKRALTTFVDNHRLLLSPSNRLTHDVLGEIFQHCLPTFHNSLLSIHEPPLSLGRVCRKWRQIAYSTPKLWTSIHFIAAPSRPWCSRGRAYKEAISSWLARSGILPLSISIQTSTDILSFNWNEKTNDRIQPFIDLIAPYTHRWKSLRLRFCFVDWLDILSQFQCTDVPLLEHLHIEDDFQRGPRVTITYDPLQIGLLSRGVGILSAPLLSSLTVPGYLAYPLETQMRWDRLTELSFCRSSQHSDLFQILGRCTNLVVCTLDLNSGSFPWTWGTLPPSQQLTLQNLTTLKIIAKPGRDLIVSRVLEDLSTPRLAHFSYKRIMTGGTWNTHGSAEELVRCLKIFLDKLVYPLEELGLWVEPVSETLLWDIIQCVPSVQRLSLRGTYEGWKRRPRVDAQPSWGNYSPAPPMIAFDDAILSWFIPEEEHDDAPIFPNLQVVHFSFARFSNKTLLQFLRCRSLDHVKLGVARLLKVGIYFERQPGSQWTQDDGDILELHKEIVALEKTGLQVYLQYPVPAKPAPRVSYWSFSNPYSGIRLLDPFES